MPREPTRRPARVGRAIDHTRHDQATGSGLVRELGPFWLCFALTVIALPFAGILSPWLSVPAFAGRDWIAPAAAVVVSVIALVALARPSLDEIRRRVPSSHLLGLLALLLALGYSVYTFAVRAGGELFWDLALLGDLFVLGQWLWRKLEVTHDPKTVSALPETAEHARADGIVETVRVRQLRPGYIILVRPGDLVAADGEVIEGESKINEAAVTGSAEPVVARPGKTVLAGSANGEGTLQVRVTHTAGETVVETGARLARALADDPSPVQARTERAAVILFIAALLIAVAAGGLAYIWGFGPAEAVRRAVAVLVAASPLALFLAIPAVVHAAAVRLARAGILVYRRAALDSARAVRGVVMDRKATAHAESYTTITRLHPLGVKTAAVIAGGSEKAAGPIARGTSIDEYVEPEDLEREVSRLQAEGRTVAAVAGQAPSAGALNRAAVGVALGRDAFESAPVVSARGNPLDLCALIEASRTSYARTTQNVAWAVGYNLVAIALAAGVLAPVGVLLAPPPAAGLSIVAAMVVALNARR